MLEPSAGNGTVWCQVKVFHRMKSLVQLQQRSPGVEVRGAGAGRAAFSLIELLFVMLIIMILFTAMWSFGSKDSQAKRKVRCQSGLQKLFISMQIYAADFSGNFPVVTNATTSEAALDVLVPRYNSDTAMFICPGSKDVTPTAGESLLKHKISYAYYMGHRSASPSSWVLMSDKQINSLSKSNFQQVFSTDGKPPGNNHHKFGGNFLFTDGHTEETSALLKFDLIQPPRVVLLNPKP